MTVPPAHALNLTSFAISVRALRSQAAHDDDEVALRPYEHDARMRIRLEQAGDHRKVNIDDHVAHRCTSAGDKDSAILGADAIYRASYLRW